MLEMLTNLKNNKIKKADTSTVDAVDRLKKLGQNLSKNNHSMYLASVPSAHLNDDTGNREPLRMSLEDLRSADTRGKWWVVGAGWAGDPLVEQKKPAQVTKPESTTTGDSQGLREIARRQGMNTDIRQSIFVILMSSEVGLLCHHPRRIPY
jgi:nucleolar MIF4G domain-containing protein 1